MILTVIIPTYNRCASLKKVLLNLTDQHSIDFNKLEIIVVDDGSTDETETIVSKISSGSDVNIKYLYCKNKGPAAARNKGIVNASGDIILFIGDDIFGEPEFLFQHYSWHKTLFPEEDIAILGYSPIVLPGDHKTSLTQEWLNRKQLAYQDLTHSKEADYYYFYTSNISLKKDFLMQNGMFDDQFPFAAGEDIELGSRLSRAGMKLIYNKKALAYHEHPITFSSFFKRYFTAGRAEAIFQMSKAHTSVLLCSPRNKFSPFLVKNPLKLICFMFLYLSSILFTYYGFFYGKLNDT